MKKLTVYIILACVPFFCINSIHAQTQTLATPALPVTTLPTNEPPSEAKAKYAEYQSYCRQNDFDETQIFTEEQKKRRMLLLENKLKKSPTDSLLLSSIINEHYINKDITTAESFFLKNKDNLNTDLATAWSAEFDVQKKLMLPAVAKLEKFISENPKSTVVLLKLAQVKKATGFYSEAAEIYTGLNLQFKKSDYSMALCEISVMDSQHKDAENNCLRARQQQPKNPLPDIYLGISYRERELFKEAQIYFENSLKRDVTEFALTCLGELFQLKKDRKMALEYLNRSVQKNKLSHRAQLGLAVSQFEDKKYDQALIHFKEACRLGNRNNSEMLKSYKILSDQKSAMASKYFDEIQSCKSK